MTVQDDGLITHIPLPEDHQQDSLALSNDDSTDIEAQMALEIANVAKDNWNGHRKREIASNKSIMSDHAQDMMAAEIFNAFETYLHTIPSGVRDKVITKFQSLLSSKRLITL